MFTSCCPAWVTLVETEYPELIPHLSSCKSPQQMLGATVKAVWCKANNLQVWFVWRLLLWFGPWQ
jgi:formate dehydrogenase major subunit